LKSTTRAANTLFRHALVLTGQIAVDDAGEVVAPGDITA